MEDFCRAGHIYSYQMEGYKRLALHQLQYQFSLLDVRIKDNKLMHKLFHARLSSI